MSGKKILVFLSHYKPCNDFLLFLLLFWLHGCNPTGTNQSKKLEATRQFQDTTHQDPGMLLPQDFIEFYNRFHADSAFQMQCIVFPLSGLPDYADPEDVKEGDFYYTADQWVLQKQFDSTKAEVKYILLSDILIEERIIENQHHLMVIRRFAKTSGGWNLIYYAGLNKYRDGD